MNKTCLAVLFLVSYLINSPAFSAQKITQSGNESTDSTLSYNKELDGFDYPFKVHTYLFSSQNQTLNMRYMDVGDKNSTRVIVLLHGKNFSGFYWQQSAQLLMDKGYRVIIPDQVGFGKSTKPAYYQYSFIQLAFNTQSLLKSLKINHYTVVGHSMGGMLASTMALNYTRSI